MSSSAYQERETLVAPAGPTFRGQYGTVSNNNNNNNDEASIPSSAVGESSGSQLPSVGAGGINHSKSTTFGDIFATKVTLTFNDIQVTLPAKKRLFGLKGSTQPLKILKGVSGIVHPGSLLAIMGASGSGKTTLMNVLTHRHTDGLVVSGDVLVNGTDMGSNISALSAYVQQEDLFIGVLTVREHLWFQAGLRMEQNVGDDVKEARIVEVIRELGLKKCENTVIGTPGITKSLSGGERKRLSFATEVLTNPSVMFCDEPTSGLDSFMAESVITTLRELASGGRTIISTIHQPSSETFALFDNLLLLAEGRVVYLGSSKGAQEYFAKNGYICPPLHNPADFYIRTLAVVPGREVESRSRLQQLSDQFIASDDGKKIDREIALEFAAPKDSARTAAIREATAKKTPFKASYMKQLRLVTWRAWLSFIRDVAVMRIRLFQNFAVALLAGLIFLRQPNNQKGVQNINGALFMICTSISFPNVATTVMSFTNELTLFKRDHENATYRTSVYYIGKSLAELPIFIIGPLIFSSVMYYLVGLRPEFDNFLICTGTIVLVSNVVVGFGTLVATIAGAPDIGMLLSGPLTVPFILFGGYLLNASSIPDYFIWLEYISWFKYGNEIFFVNQWHNYGHIDCEYNPYGNSTVPTTRCFENGQQVLDSFDYSYDNLATDFAALAGLFVGFRLIAYLFLYLRANPLRKSVRKTKTH